MTQYGCPHLALAGLTAGYDNNFPLNGTALSWHSLVPIVSDARDRVHCGLASILEHPSVCHVHLIAPREVRFRHAACTRPAVISYNPNFTLGPARFRGRRW